MISQKAIRRKAGGLFVFAAKPGVDGAGDIGHFPRMSTLAEIEKAADALPLEEAEQLLQHLTERLHRTPAQPGERIAGLHPGAIVMAPDFDAPLPDEFWLGKDA